MAGRLLALLTALVSLLAPASPVVAKVRGNGHARAELVFNTDALRPGQQAIAAIVVTIDDGYHAQSSEPLDENLIAFEASVSADSRLKPLETLYPPGEVEDFAALGGKLSVYSKRVVAYVPFVVAEDATPGAIEVKASVGLQLCNDQMCDPPGTLSLSINTTIVAKDGVVHPSDDAVFRQFDPNVWMHQHPRATTSPGGTTPEQPTPEQPTLAGLPWTPFSDAALASARKSGKPVIIDFTAAWCVNCHVVERRVYGHASTVAELARRGVTLIKADLTVDGAPGSALLAALQPSRSIPFTAVYFPGSDRPAPLSGIYSSAELLATLDDGGKTTKTTTTFFGIELTTASLPIKLLAALGVGLLLNAVPCVLPVLPLKAMSFYEDAGHNRVRSLVNGLAFSLGIVATFGGLALFVITQDALWGKFISHPITAAVLAVVLLGAAAQAFGLFEFALPRSVTNLESAAGGTSYVSNFFSGILIAVLSTPCTIGLFAAVIAVALKSGSALGTIVLMVVGVGMALPWLALSAFPEVTRRFPRTGPWPAVVKQMTAFLLVATAIFFAAPLMSASFRASALWWLIFACVSASAVFLILRTIQIAPRPRPIVIASGVAGLLIACGLSMTLALTS